MAAQTIAYDMDIIKACAQQVNLSEGVVKIARVRFEAAGVGNREGAIHLLYIISEVLTYPFVVIGEQASKPNAQAFLVHLTLHNAVQSFKELGATRRTNEGRLRAPHTSLRKVVHDTMTLMSWMSNTE